MIKLTKHIFALVLVLSTSIFFSMTIQANSGIKGKKESADSKDLKVYNAISPNGDGVNDYLRIEGIRGFKNNTLRVYNRWGVEVYSQDGYDADVDNNEPVNSFRGVSDGRFTLSSDRLLPTGTYFYVLDYETTIGGGSRQQSGYLYIN